METKTKKKESFFGAFKGMGPFTREDRMADRDFTCYPFVSTKKKSTKS